MMIHWFAEEGNRNMAIPNSAQASRNGGLSVVMFDCRRWAVISGYQRLMMLTDNDSCWSSDGWLMVNQWSIVLTVNEWFLSNLWEDKPFTEANCSLNQWISHRRFVFSHLNQLSHRGLLTMGHGKQLLMAVADDEKGLPERLLRRSCGVKGLGP